MHIQYQTSVRAFRSSNTRVQASSNIRLSHRQGHLALTIMRPVEAR